MHEPGLADIAWWKLHGRRFALATAITATLVIAGGWLTGAREVMHGALLSFAVAAFLPFVIIAAGVGLILLVGYVAVVLAVITEGAYCGEGAPEAAEGGAAIVETGAQMVPKYYRFLSRRKHPVFWGASAGVLLGGIILWAVLAIFVMPGEARTADTLNEARAAIELHYAKHGALPKPDEDHHLVIDGKMFEDGEGRPLDYRMVARWKLGAWQLRSFGYDGERSGDDLCVEGGTPLVMKVAQAAELLELSRRTRSLGERLESIRAMRCDR